MPKRRSSMISKVLDRWKSWNHDIILVYNWIYGAQNGLVGQPKVLVGCKWCENGQKHQVTRWVCDSFGSDKEQNQTSLRAGMAPLQVASNI